MSENDKKVIEQNSHGEFELTAYGEFLSYFHTHIQLFNGLISAKKFPPPIRRFSNKRYVLMS